MNDLLPYAAASPIWALILLAMARVGRAGPIAATGLLGGLPVILGASDQWVGMTIAATLWPSFIVAVLAVRWADGRLTEQSTPQNQSYRVVGSEGPASGESAISGPWGERVDKADDPEKAVWDSAKGKKPEWWG